MTIRNNALAHNALETTHSPRDAEVAATRRTQLRKNANATLQHTSGVSVDIILQLFYTINNLWAVNSK